MKQLSTLLCCLGDLGVALGLKNQGQINQSNLEVLKLWRLTLVGVPGAH